MNRREREESADALLARLDERSYQAIEALETLKQGHTRIVISLDEVKSETLSARSEVAAVKAKMTQLEERESERNSHIAGLMDWRTEHEREYRVLTAQAAESRDEMNARVYEVEGDVEVLKNASHDRRLVSDTRTSLWRTQTKWFIGGLSAASIMVGILKALGV